MNATDVSEQRHLGRWTDGRQKPRRQASRPPTLANGSTANKRLQEAEPQLVELKFQAPSHGRYDLTLYCVSGVKDHTNREVVRGVDLMEGLFGFRV